MYRPLEHTLGPRPDRSFPEWYHTCPAVRDERGQEIAVVTLSGYTVGKEATPRQWADLFAAAPALREALQQLVEACRGFAPDGVTFEPRDKARALLATLPGADARESIVMAPEKPVEMSECCHAPIHYDAYVDSNNELAAGPFDDCVCSNCGMHHPDEWDGNAPAWPRSEREGGADLPEGVDEPAESAAIMSDSEVREWHDLSQAFWDTLTQTQRESLRREAQSAEAESPTIPPACL